MFCLGRGEFQRLIEVAGRAYPREACGLLFAPSDGRTQLRLVPTATAWNTPLSFRISGQEIDRLRGERKLLGEQLLGCFHSHILSPARPSRFDRRGAQRLGGLWLIYSVLERRAALFHWSGTNFKRQSLRLH
jgi:proteasome lid subunit RPN8/RPN11